METLLGELPLARSPDAERLERLASVKSAGSGAQRLPGSVV